MLQLRQQNSYLAFSIARLILMLARVNFARSGDFTCVWTIARLSWHGPQKHPASPSHFCFPQHDFIYVETSCNMPIVDCKLWLFSQIANFYFLKMQSLFILSTKPLIKHVTLMAINILCAIICRFCCKH